MKMKLLASLSIAIMLAVVVCFLPCPVQAASEHIEITAQRFSFTPNEVTLKKGVPVVLVLTSKDVDHGLKFKELNVNIEAKKGNSSEVTFTPTKAGTFVGQCSVFCGSGHGEMKMTLHVTE